MKNKTKTNIKKITKNITINFLDYLLTLLKALLSQWIKKRLENIFTDTMKENLQ